ncbi:MFS transporter, partial [Dietzia sp. SLG310A2-38A2]|nr:MFS transporter [Dietzia sp. SLG310A2-38A2]
MTTSPATGTAPTPRRVAVAILALALGGFGIGVTEFAAMGLLRSIADDFGLT